MKLIDFHESSLAEIRKKIGAELITYSAIDWPIREPEIIAIDPSTINISDNDSTITNKNGERIVVYIRDWSKFYYDTQGSLPTIHFYNCSTIRKMIEDNSFDSRYVGAYTINGLLFVNLIEKDKATISSSQEFNLRVCKNCLKDGENDGLIDEELLTPFNLSKFFDFYEYYRNRVTSPKYNFITIAKNQYPRNWEEISKIERQKVGYICQGKNCGKDCSNDKGNLHVHHIDRNKGNNFTDNFLVLCYDCHAKYHPHMR